MVFVLVLVLTAAQVSLVKHGVPYAMHIGINLMGSYKYQSNPGMFF